MTPTAIVNKVWNLCHTLRDDGMGYGDHLDKRKELEANTRSSFGLRAGLSRPYFVAQPALPPPVRGPGQAPMLGSRASSGREILLARFRKQF